MSNGKKKITCPRCNSTNARANARGPNVIWCSTCGGFVELIDRDDPVTAYSDDPEYNAMAKEQGWDKVGRVKFDPKAEKTLRGGLK